MMKASSNVIVLSIVKYRLFYSGYSQHGMEFRRRFWARQSLLRATHLHIAGLAAIRNSMPTTLFRAIKTH